MHLRFNHRTVRTPLDTLNIMGAGGLREGSLTEAYGPPGSGKSAFAYQVAGFFHEDNPWGSVHIIDVENSVDYIRLRDVFKVDMDRVEIHSCRSLEEGFEVFIDGCKRLEDQSNNDKLWTPEHALEQKFEDVEKYIREAYKDLKKSEKEIDRIIRETENKDDCKLRLIKRAAAIGKLRSASEDDDHMLPVLVIWDTIAVSKPKVEVEAARDGGKAMNAGGMGMTARVISQYFGITISEMVNRPITGIIINQVRLSGFGTWAGPKEDSSGGFAFKHNIHYRLYFQIKKKHWNDDLQMNTGTLSKLKIQKAKFCPTTQDVELMIDDRLGGVIVPKEEAAVVCIKLGLLKSSGGWWKFTNRDYPSMRWDSGGGKNPHYVANNPEVRQICLEEIAKHYRKCYWTLDTLYRETGNTLGELTDEERSEQMNMISDMKMAEPTHNDDGDIVIDTVSEKKDEKEKA